jgi:hypothetical protein
MEKVCRVSAHPGLVGVEVAGAGRSTATAGGAPVTGRRSAGDCKAKHHFESVKRNIMSMKIYDFLYI